MNINDLLNLLIVQPDNPEEDHLLLFKGLFNVIKNNNWKIKSSGLINKLKVLTSCIGYLST